MLPVDRPRDRRSWAILAQDFFEEASHFGQKEKDAPREGGTRAMLDAPAASLDSENCRVKSAVEMTPRGKRRKLKNPKRVFHSFHRACKSGKNQGAGFPHFHRAGGGSITLGRTK